VSKDSLRADSIAYVFLKKIENIIFRIKAIQKNYKQINDATLKIRLIKEHEVLKNKFIKINSLVILMNNSSSNKLSLSRLLNEKCNRCKKEIYKNKYLFSA
tara:strand:- start:89 stop:391 length:303 start_codon:yes stop_codon:yes gene_type:complete